MLRHLLAALRRARHPANEPVQPRETVEPKVESTQQSNERRDEFELPSLLGSTVAQPQEGERRYFGESLWGASEKHRTAAPNSDRWDEFGLPHIHTEAELAAWLGISLGRLRWFTYDEAETTTWHYVRYVRRKCNGKERIVLAPKRDLKALQRKVLEGVLQQVPLSYSAHGFVRGRSTLTNAQSHIGRQVVIGLDLSNFFPTIIHPRVRGMFIALGYSFTVASTLALLCTERDREPIDRNGTAYYVAKEPRYLVQGAPTSPALANIIAWRMDGRLSALATGMGFEYTRYADDMTFSGTDVTKIHALLSQAQKIIKDEDFVLNEDKTRIIRQSGQQMVTGFEVNSEVATPRRYRRELRAILHNAQRSGLESQNRCGHRTFREHLQGRIAYIEAAQPQHARKLRASLDALE